MLQKNDTGIHEYQTIFVLYRLLKINFCLDKKCMNKGENICIMSRLISTYFILSIYIVFLSIISTNDG